MGHSTYLESKDEGESSMLKKQRSTEDMYEDALQDPHPMARARLPELQFPVGVGVLPSVACLRPMPVEPGLLRKIEAPSATGT